MGALSYLGIERWERGQGQVQGYERRGVFKLQTNFVHKQKPGGIWTHLFALSLAPQKLGLASTGLNDKKPNMCLALRVPPVGPTSCLTLISLTMLLYPF